VLSTTSSAAARPAGPVSGPVMIEARGIQKIYGDPSTKGYHALDALDVQIMAGEFFCLLGASGCGKTTLLNILAGFEGISAGKLTLNGQPITGPDRRRILLFQDANEALFPWLSVVENVEFGLRIAGTPKAERREPVDYYLSMVGLSDHRNKLPSELSGGMRQRVQIARALVMDPEIILMDEPFAALDALTRRRMNLELLRIWEKTRKTVILVTHDIPEAITLSDRIAMMTLGPRSRIQEIIHVDMERPRTPDAQRFGELYREIEAKLGA
jgi:NitT/TauT family transport system ATP-binding protein